MSFFKNKEYEIHTSMSEELILEEIKEMDKKFLPILLAPTGFSLWVLTETYKSTRKRTGGFLQVNGSISEQDGYRCLQVKHVSGAGFVLASMSGVLFIFFIVVVLLAGGGSWEISILILFWSIFFLMMMYMTITESEVAERLLREHFEGTDHAVKFCYRTHYTKEQCLEFMQHDNMNDIYKYEWRQEKNFGALVIKDYKVPNHILDFNGRQEWGFIVRFHQQPDGTGAFIEAELVQTEKLPFIHNKSKVDAFWKRKLEAIANG